VSGPHDIFDPAGPNARQIATLGTILFTVCGIVYVLVLAALGWALARRRLPSDGAPDTQRRLDRVVAGATGVTVVTIVALTTASFVFGRGLTSPPGAGAITIDAVGHQWWWDFQYRDVSPTEFVSTPNELHVPVGYPIVIKAQSRDVIHSFWAPNLLGKRDLIPGQVTNTWFQADREGTYTGLCAEFCGHQHAQMRFTVVAEPMPRFLAWLNRQRASAAPAASEAARRGEQVFQQAACVMCHTVRGTPVSARLGPDLTHIGSRPTIAAGVLPNTPANLAAWIRDPQAIKPGNRMPAVPIADADLDALVAYLRGLQ
jgi:cytochrome c oxidase subunit 2